MRLFDREHLAVHSVDINNCGEFFFTDLALELTEVELRRPAHGFLLDLDLNPLDETVDVHTAARAHAFTRIE